MMRSMARSLIRLALTVLVCLFTVCSGLTLAAGSEKERVLTIAIGNDVETCDPMFSSFQMANENHFNTYDMFFQYGWKDTGKGYSLVDTTDVRGRAVESWKVSDDFRTVTLRVRQGVKFNHTGNPMTADDFVYFFERAFGTESGAKFNLQALKIPDLGHIEKTGPMEIKIHFDGPSPYFFALFRDQAMAVLDSVEVKKHATKDDPWATKWLAKHDAGAGPYYIDSWTPGVEMVLKANKNYWAGAPYYDKVVLKIVPSSASRALLLQQGAVDIALDLNKDEIEALRHAPGVKVLSVPTRNQVTVGLNNKMKPFDNVKVRQALSYAVPYDDIVNGVFNGRALESKGPVAVLGQFHDSSAWPYKYDLDKARKLLAEAGYPNGFEFTLDIVQGTPVMEQVAVVLKNAFSKIGVNMNINKQSSSVFAEKLWNVSHQAYMRDIIWYVDDPGYIATWGYKTGGICNWVGYSNKRVDEIADELGITMDRSRRAELSSEFQRVVDEDAPLLFVAEIPFEIAMRQSIQGYVQLPDNYLYYHALRQE